MARNNNQSESTALTVQPPRLPMPPEAAAAGIPAGRWKALVDAVFPSAKSVDGVMLAVRYCEARNLDVFKRVVHVVPMWNSALGREVETVWPGIAEVRTTASRTGIWAGNDDCQFGRIIRQAFNHSRSGQRRNQEPYSNSASCPEMEYPEWAQITVYKIVAGQRVAFVGPKVRFLEIFSGQKGLRVPNERWQQAPFQMLEKCAEAAALRRAFPDELGDEWTAEEMEGKDARGVEDPESAAYVDAEIVQDGDAGGAQDDANTRDLNGWEEDRLTAYVDYLRKGFSGCESIDQVDNAASEHEQRISTLPKDEADAVAGYISAARQRLAKKSGGKARSGENARDHADDQEKAGDKAESQPAADEKQPEQPGEPKFVANLRRRVEETDKIEDLETLESAERRIIDQQPDDIAAACDRLFRERRREIQSR